jgi:uncharacterized membrane protein
MSEDDDIPGIERRGLTKGRIETLADGIFAVAMTLLVLDIKAPTNHKFETAPDLLRYLSALEHSFAMYAISFFVLAIFWIAHHLLFHFVRHADHRMLWLNIAFLLLVTFVPFSTDLLGDQGHLLLPVVVYGVNLLALGSLLALQLRYLVKTPALATADLTPVIVKQMWRDLRVHGYVPLASMAVSLISPRTGMYMYLLLAIPMIAPSRLDRLIFPGAGPRVDSSRESS